MSIVSAAAAAAGLYLLACLVLSRWATLPASHSERIAVATDDGWTLSVKAIDDGKAKRDGFGRRTIGNS